MISVTIINLVKSKVGTMHEPLVNKLASEHWPVGNVVGLLNIQVRLE
jgi:hypothetical protein